MKKRVEDNARVMQNKRKSSNSKSPMTTPTSKSPPYSKITSKSPQSSAPKSPHSKASEKRIRVTSSDGRTCNLKLDVSVTYVQLQEAIEQELKYVRDAVNLGTAFLTCCGVTVTGGMWATSVFAYSPVLEH